MDGIWDEEISVEPIGDEGDEDLLNLFIFIEIIFQGDF